MILGGRCFDRSGWLPLAVVERHSDGRRPTHQIYGGSLRFSSGEENETIEMGDPSTEGARKPRSDAVRNRERVLEAAKEVFSAGGPEASLEAVARRAGVGIGTLYRHFPTREALFEAVYRREVQQLGELAEQLKSETAPVEALRQWLRAIVALVATKKGMSAALALAMHGRSELYAEASDRLTNAVSSLLDRAVAAGEIRRDIGAEDLMRTLVGMCYTHDQPGWQASVLRLVDVFVDGLRIGPTTIKRAPDSEAIPARSSRRRHGPPLSRG
jgi:AcrR family transcriptional regulator